MRDSNDHAPSFITPATRASVGRRTTGAVLVEGAASLILVSAVGTGLVLFLLSSATTAYYKQQLGFLTTQTASYAAANSSSGTVATQATAFASAMEKQMGIGSGSPTVTTSTTTVNGIAATSVTVKDKFSVSGVGRGIWNINLQSTAVAVTSTGNAATSSNGADPQFGAPVAYYAPGTANAFINGIPASDARMKDIPLVPVFSKANTTASAMSLRLYGLSTVP